MSGHGPSGTASRGPSGTGGPDHREPESARALPIPASRTAPNHANRESFGFLLTPRHLWKAAAGPAQPQPAKGCPDPAVLTHVLLVWHGGVREDWLRFGKPVRCAIIDRRRRYECYAPGQVFALVRWSANAFGTVRSDIAVVRAAAPGAPLMRLAQVEPGGEILLEASGWPRVRAVLALIDAIEAAGHDPCEVAPDYWRHVHNRLAAGERPRPYTAERHRAWRLRKALLP